MDSYFQDLINFLPEIKQNECKSLIEDLRKEHKFYLVNKLMITTLKEITTNKNDELSTKLDQIITNYELRKCKNNQEQCVIDLIGLNISDYDLHLNEEELEKLHMIINIRLNEKVNTTKNLENISLENTDLMTIQNQIINDIKELYKIRENYKKSLSIGEKQFSDFQQLLKNIDNLSEDINKSSYFNNILNFTRLRSLDYQLKTKMFLEDEDTKIALTKLEEWYDNQLSIYKARMDNATITLDEYNEACLSPEYKNLLKEYLNLQQNVTEKEKLLKELQNTSGSDVK